jgi:hypothetical protein
MAAAGLGKRKYSWEWPRQALFSMAGGAGLGGRGVLAEQKQQGQQQCRCAQRGSQPGAGCQQEKQQEQPETGTVCCVRCAAAVMMVWVG